MMTQRQQTDIRILQALFTDARFESIFNAIDRLHDAASSGKLAEVTNLTADEVIGWLQDIAYTAKETIRELEEPGSDACEWEALFEVVNRPSFN
jgi:gluconate kinase